jgi:hypothetical protein
VFENDSLTANDIAAFLDGSLTGADLTRVQSLLAVDKSARMEVAEASRLIATAPRRSSLPARWLAIGGIAAIAAVGLIMVRPGEHLEQSIPRVSERRAPIEMSDRIELVSPADGQIIERSSLTLTWRSIDGAAYHVVVSDPAGRMVFKQDTNDTSLVVPLNSLKLTNGVLYWTVDAQTPDGSSVTSGPRPLTVVAK